MFIDKENYLNEKLKNIDPREDGLKNYKIWKKKYKIELLDYNYIHTLEEFILLRPGGLIKPVSLMTEEICHGGILINIEKDIKNKWYALLGYFKNREKGNGKFRRIYVDIPLDILYSKMLVFSMMMGTYEDILILVCILSQNKNAFRKSTI